MVGVPLIRCCLANTAMSSIGLAQSAGPVGTAPLCMISPHALARSGAHQTARDLAAACGCNWSIGNRKT